MDRFARVRGDTRLRATADGRSSVAVVAKTEPLSPLPAVPYPVIVTEARTASRQALVSYRGNRYSVPPELAAAPGDGHHPVGGRVLRHRHHRRDRHRPASDGRRRARGDGPRQRTRHRPRYRGDGHRRHRATAPPQGTHPTRARGAKPLPHNYFNCTHETPALIESSTPSTDSTVIDLSAYERAAQNRTIQ